MFKSAWRSMKPFSRIGELSIGHSINWLIVYGFEYILYPFVIYWLGFWWGFLVMAILSFIVCWLTMKFYDWAKRDWLGIEAVKSLKEYSGTSRTGRSFAWIMRQSDPIACVLLSLKFDPFIVTVYLRRNRFGGMCSRDWRIFLLSWLVGNAWWSLFCLAGVETVTGLWRWLWSSAL